MQTCLSKKNTRSSGPQGTCKSQENSDFCQRVIKAFCQRVIKANCVSTYVCMYLCVCVCSNVSVSVYEHACV